MSLIAWDMFKNKCDENNERYKENGYRLLAYTKVIDALIWAFADEKMLIGELNGEMYLMWNMDTRTITDINEKLDIELDTDIDTVIDE